jgi:N-lysine methyltransferase SETD6
VGFGIPVLLVFANYVLAVATHDISSDEELFALPRSIVLHLHTSSLTKKLGQPLPDLDPWLPLILTIIYELLRGKDSPWAPYLHLLATRFNTLMFWSEEELGQLKGSQVLEKIGKEAAEAEWRHTIIPIMLEHPALFPTVAESHEEKTNELTHLAHRAGSLIMTCAFDINKEESNEAGKENSDAESYLVSDDEDDDTFKGMVPFADLLNADADRNNARLFQEDNYLIMRSTAPIKAGEQIFNDYGPLPRSDLLRMYGFITPNYAQYDVVELSNQDITAAAQNTKKEISTSQRNGMAALDELGLLEDSYIIQRAPNDCVKLVDAIPTELHMLLRALTCNLGNDASSIEKRFRKGVKNDVTIEEASLLASVCTKRLTDYPTTAEQDDALLEKLEAPSNISPCRFEMAIQVRKGEKEILHNIIKICQDHITRRMSEIQAASTATKRKHEGERGRSTEKQKLLKKSKKEGFR